MPLVGLTGRASPDLPATHWVVTWGASPSPALANDAEMAKSHLLFKGQTLREIVHTSLGGGRVRVRLSNVFGTESVRIGAASIETRGGSGSTLTFGGRPFMVIPPNAIAISDPVSLELPASGDLAISLFLPDQARGAGIHYAASQTSYVAEGDLTASTAWPATGDEVSYWAFLEGVDVEAPLSAFAVAAFGDSITDGAHSTRNSNARWPDVLAGRLLARGGGAEIGVLNAGIGGNRILHDGVARIQFGVNALARFDRDVLVQPGLRYLIVLEGINDIGHAGTSAPVTEAVTSEDLIGGLSQLAERAHEHGLKVFAGTLTPFDGAAAGYFTPDKEKIRSGYNAWIRSAPILDGVIDFDQAIRDPDHPTQVLAAYDSGDHLHPNDAGYRAMGNAVDLGLFR